MLPQALTADFSTNKWTCAPPFSAGCGNSLKNVNSEISSNTSPTHPNVCSIYTPRLNKIFAACLDLKLLLRQRLAAVSASLLATPGSEGSADTAKLPRGCAQSFRRPLIDKYHRKPLWNSIMTYVLILRRFPSTLVIL